MSEGRFGPKDLPPAPVGVLDELIELAQRFGRDPDFSRGGGGNASAKVDGVLYIKPSGVALATLTAADLVPLDMAPLLALLNADDPAADHATAGDPRPGADVAAGGDPGDVLMRTAMAARLAHAGGRRPSVELLFHAFLPDRFVLHTHPPAINAVTCNSDGAALAKRLFGDEALWVPYTNPGLPLARAIVGGPPRVRGAHGSARSAGHPDAEPRDHRRGRRALADRRALGVARRHGPCGDGRPAGWSGVRVR